MSRARFLVLVPLCLVVVACASNVDSDPPRENVSERTEATTCSIQLSAYPVKGPHNNGYDPTAGNSSLWSCGDANSNSDFVAGDHLGNDIWAAEGTPVVATVSGTLTLVGWSNYSGNKVTIIDGCNWYHFYCHLQSIAPGIGNGGYVSAGTVIGYVGKTGTASNGVVHLHYSIYPDGNYDAGVDPWPYTHAVEQNACGCGPEICNGVDDDCNGTADDGGVCVVDQLLVPQMGTIDQPVSSDVDGDGLADLCARSSFGFACQRAAETGFDTSIPGPELSDGNGWAEPRYYGTLRMGDINGDGKADLCGRGAAGVGCWPSDGTGLGTQINGPAWSDDSGWGEIRFWSTIRMADVDGDGKSDLCARASAGFSCLLSDGNGFPTSISGPEFSDAGGWGETKYYSTIRMADVNGDDKVDVCARSSIGFSCWLSDGTALTTPTTGPELSDANGWAEPRFFSTIRMADVNGDKKVDVCARSSTNFHCWLSDGEGFPTEVLGPEMSDANGWGDPMYFATIRMADLNGDTKADLCARASDGLLCWLSTGSAFSEEPIALADLSNANGWDQPQYYTTIRLADIDGNGMADVCGRDANGIACWQFDGEAFGAKVLGPEWSDVSGWGNTQYFSTLHLAGGCSESADCGTSGSGSGGSGTGGWSGSGGAFGGNGGDGVKVKPESGDDGSCAVSTHQRTNPVALFVLGIAALVLGRRSRRR
jgi:hypothetical protein